MNMSEVFVYLVDLPDGFQEVVMPCADGNYTVYIDARLDNAQRQEAYQHAIRHIQNDDFSKTDVQSIEYEAHRKDELE
jgi:hypothetical protein